MTRAWLEFVTMRCNTMKLVQIAREITFVMQRSYIEIVKTKASNSTHLSFNNRSLLCFVVSYPRTKS